jgi:hypothetical protein
VDQKGIACWPEVLEGWYTTEPHSDSWVSLGSPDSLSERVRCADTSVTEQGTLISALWNTEGTLFKRHPEQRTVEFGGAHFLRGRLREE